MPSAGGPASDPEGDGTADVVFSVQNRVATIRLNRPSKYNGWREADTQVIRGLLERCMEDDAVGAVILTGTGTYYSAGADIFSSIKFTRPSVLRDHITCYNEGIFDMFLNFRKPLITAVNGPAVGMAVTSSLLTDLVLASSTATFVTPFARLGLPPEGCSSFNFPRLLGEDNARVLLEDCRKVDAQEALGMGLVSEVLEPESLMPRAQEVAEQLAAQGRPRPMVEQGLVEKLKAVNAEESRAFGLAVISRRFFESQLQLAREKGKQKEATVWWLLANTVPWVSRL